MALMDNCALCLTPVQATNDIVQLCSQSCRDKMNQSKLADTKRMSVMADAPPQDVVNDLNRQVAELREEMSRGGNAGTLRGTLKGRCPHCELDLAQYPFCAKYGRKHITAAQCESRIREVKKRFPFPDAVIDTSKTGVANVMHFVAFYDVYGAPESACADAEMWLKVHMVKYLDRTLYYPRTNFESKPANPYAESFVRYCEPPK
eukprot:TRINITY_DN32623_c0_g2_i1.p1 TRINITY_DN32623_c0_g2~~TRINITY_DN32623_c0_g2_i1.p1  ORF type:complete len:204 (+),score=40.23 TRINITY_DN32623_c0_g2_i1:60-671(+)